MIRPPTLTAITLTTTTTTTVAKTLSAPLTGLRDAINSLAVIGTRSVEIVRDAVVKGIPTLQTASPGSAADFIDRFSRDKTGSAVVKNTARFGLSTAKGGQLVQAPHPEIDFIEIGNDQLFGVIDSFYSRIVVSLPIEDIKNVSVIRVLRTTNDQLKIGKPSFSAMVDISTHTQNRKGNPDVVAAQSFRAGELGAGNKLTSFVADDQFSGQRAVISSTTLKQPPPTINTNKTSLFQTGLLSVDGADRSVLENTTFFVNRRTIEPGKDLQPPLSAGSKSGVNILKGSSVGRSSAVIESGNSAGYKEIGRISVNDTMTRRVGDYVEVQFFDPTIIHGASFTYYVVCVDKNGIDGPRSRLVKLDVMRRSPPKTPEVVYSVVAGRPRFSVRCDGKFVDHVEVYRKGGRIPKNAMVLGSSKSMISRHTPSKMNSGFYHIGDLGAGADKAMTFVDTDVTPGNKLEYRFYSVDSFGSKSQTPFACAIMLPDRGQPVPLDPPSITAQQALGSRKISVGVSCDDPRIESFIVSRREVGNSENGYRQVTHPDYVTISNSTDTKRARSRIGPHLVDGNKAWLGVLPSLSGSATMADTAVGLDRVYQYSVVAVDSRGNRTSSAQSEYVKISVKPIIESPVNVNAEVAMGDDGEPSSILITWDPGTSDFRPQDLIEDQDVLAATSQRSLFQVERREAGTFQWLVMPATTSSFFVDEASDSKASTFRPPYVSVGKQYDYRVIAMQSGGFISQYTDPVRVSALPGAMPPQTLWVRSTPTSIRPIHNVISWNYNGRLVDGWEVQRAVVNKLYGSKIVSTESSLARELNYENIANVKRESSRASGLASDVGGDKSVFIGNRFFIDQDVSLANSYFYRARTTFSDGTMSEWIYSGLSMVDSPFDRKFFSSLSDKEKTSFSADKRPITGWGGK